MSEIFLVRSMRKHCPHNSCMKQLSIATFDLESRQSGPGIVTPYCTEQLGYSKKLLVQCILATTHVQIVVVHGGTWHVGTQLIRRNDELALLYEKIKILQSSLSRGQSQYRARLNEIRILRIKLADLNRELNILKRSVADVNVLKREVHSLGRQLLQECTKVKALSEELENPLNVHRYCAAFKHHSTLCASFWRLPFP
jgi:hypothetical protein